MTGQQGEPMSKAVARAAMMLALTKDREAENAMKALLKSQGIASVAVDYGGEFGQSVQRLIEKAVVAARRSCVTQETHLDEGAVAGATHEAIMQILPKAMGCSVGGKMAVARQAEHVCVAIFFGIGLGHLNEVALGLGHRVLQSPLTTQERTY